MSELGHFGKATEALMQVLHDYLNIYIAPRQKKADAKAAFDIQREKLINEYELCKLDLEQRAKLRLYETEIRRQYNLEQIGCETVKRLPETATPQKIDKDWLHHFATCAQDVGDEEMQNIWAELLAQEALSPGKYSKRTLDYLKNFSVEDCKVFEKILPYIFKRQYSPNRQAAFLVFNWIDIKPKPNSDINFSTRDVVDLFNIGIITMLGNIGTAFEPSQTYNCSYFGKKIKIVTPGKETVNVIDLIPLTDVGTQLTNVVEAKPNEHYFDTAISKLKSFGLHIEIS